MHDRGHEGDDVLDGTAGDDVICGYGGNDTIAGHEGDDVIYGGDGDDVIGGGMGDDLIYGEAGADTVEGKRGDDTIYGGLGNDDLAGNEDNDLIYGGAGDDAIGGGMGDDLIYGEAGADTVEGKRGDDTIYGGLGNDDLAGNEDNDIIYGGGGDDLIGGGMGSDELYGGDGDDALDGKAGNDTLVGGIGTDNADGADGNDACSAETTISCESSINDLEPPETSLVFPANGDVVFGIETLTATGTDNTAIAIVEFIVDGTPIASGTETSPGVFSATWDTSTTESSVIVSARATDQHGNTSNSAEVNVTVDNGLGATDRLDSDYERGLITVDQHIEYGIWAITNPGLLDSRYLGAPPNGDDEELTPYGLQLLAEWDQLNTEAQTRITEFLTLQEIQAPAAQSQSATSTQAFATPSYDGVNVCGGVNSAATWFVFYKVFRCRYVVYTDGGDEPFDIRYTPDNLVAPSWLEALLSLGGLTDLPVSFAEPVSSADVEPANGIPDAIDTIAGSLVESYSVYTDASLDYPAPSTPIQVVVHETRGLVIPDAGIVDRGSPIVQIDNDTRLVHLSRHELFHAFQYEHVGLDDVDRDTFGLLWWMEASAQWAAGKVNEVYPDDSAARAVRQPSR